MAAHLALGASLVDAVKLARIFVRAGLRSGAAVRTGQGGGPLNHGHGPLAMQLKKLV
jgi:hydroxymethylpyrimidine/phosphomethylpyrimidine kinase